MRRSELPPYKSGGILYPSTPRYKIHAGKYSGNVIKTRCGTKIKNEDIVYLIPEINEDEAQITCKRCLKLV